jgi:RNA polymerase sigma factor (sigma-70 family)
MSDEILWSKMKQGDPKALKEIYDLHIHELENYCKKFTKDVELIEDALHDMFVQIWQKRDTIGHTDSIMSYLCVSLRRDLIKRVNKATLTTSIENTEKMDINFSISAEDIMIHEENKEDDKAKLQKAFEHLSHRQREAIYLKYYNEMSYEEICTVMDINYQSVRNLISKGILLLREKIVSVLLIIFVNLYF